MNKIVVLFNEVFQDCQAYGDLRELLKDNFPEVKKWRRYAISQHIIFYMESKAVKNQIQPQVKRETIEKKQQMALWNL